MSDEEIERIAIQLRDKCHKLFLGKPAEAVGIALIQLTCAVLTMSVENETEAHDGADAFCNDVKEMLSAHFAAQDKGALN